MKLCALFSGGKDSMMSVFRGMEENEISVLLSMVPESDESYMYHVPNIHLTKYAAEAMGIPIVMNKSTGKPPQENVDLKNALKDIKEQFGIEGVAAGAVGSNYQYKIVADICRDLGLKTYTPYWKKDHARLIKDAIDAGFVMIFVGVAAHGLDDSWLGRTLDYKALEDLKTLNVKYKVDVGGEGGEYETLVIDGPIFKKRIEILEKKKVWDTVRGQLVIEKVRLRDK